MSRMIQCDVCGHTWPEHMVYVHVCKHALRPLTVTDNGHGQDIGPAPDWTATPPTETGHYWWRCYGQDEAQGICELIEHDGEMYFAHTGFLAYENGEPINREYWPVRIEEPPR